MHRVREGATSQPCGVLPASRRQPSAAAPRGHPAGPANNEEDMAAHSDAHAAFREAMAWAWFQANIAFDPV